MPNRKPLSTDQEVKVRRAYRSAGNASRLIGEIITGPTYAHLEKALKDQLFAASRELVACSLALDEAIETQEALHAGTAK